MKIDSEELRQKINKLSNEMGLVSIDAVKKAIKECEGGATKMNFTDKELFYLCSLLEKEIVTNAACQHCKLNHDNKCFFALMCLSNDNSLFMS